MRTKGLRVGPVLVSLVALAGPLIVARRGAADAPPGRYLVVSAGVYDTETKLTWEQPPTSLSYSWANAGAYCAQLTGGPWRLPSMQELQTLVDDSRTNPAIDPTFFPGAPAAFTWTASPYVPTPGNAWYFYSGFTASALTSTPYHVRCVH